MSDRDNSPSNNPNVHWPEKKVPRQRVRAEKFRKAFQQAKAKLGYGVYSWTEGVTRKSARKIARRLALRSA